MLFNDLSSPEYKCDVTETWEQYQHMGKNCISSKFSIVLEIEGVIILDERQIEGRLNCRLKVKSTRTRI